MVAGPRRRAGGARPALSRGRAAGSAAATGGRNAIATRHWRRLGQPRLPDTQRQQQPRSPRWHRRGSLGRRRQVRRHEEGVSQHQRATREGKREWSAESHRETAWRRRRASMARSGEDGVEREIPRAPDWAGYNNRGRRHCTVLYSTRADLIRATALQSSVTFATHFPSPPTCDALGICLRVSLEEPDPTHMGNVEGGVGPVAPPAQKNTQDTTQRRKKENTSGACALPTAPPPGGGWGGILFTSVANRRRRLLAPPRFLSFFFFLFRSPPPRRSSRPRVRARRATGV